MIEIIVSEKEAINSEFIFSCITIGLTIIGGVFAYRQWVLSNKIKKSEFINQIVDRLRFDSELAGTMYKIEYNKFLYNDEFHGGKFEFELDKLLAYLTYICYLKSMKHIADREFKILNYELNRVCASYEVQSYLWNLYHFAKERNIDCTFGYLINYGLKNKIIDCTFYNKRSSYFLKNKKLNFDN